MSRGLVGGQWIFTIWFGVGLPPLVICALAIAFNESLWLGLASSSVFAAWFYESGRTTCARCGYYGTAKCGLPGLIAPMFTERKSAASLPDDRIRSHRRLDLWILVFLTGVSALYPPVFVASLIWSLGVWRISLGPKRYHGLLGRLRDRPPKSVAPVEQIAIVSFARERATK